MASVFVCACMCVCVCECMYACVCVCARACVCMCVLWAGRETGRLPFWRSSCQSPSAVRAPPTIQPENCPSGPQSRSRSGASDLVTHSFNNGLRTYDVLNIILGPEDTPMGRKENTHSFGLRWCPSSRDAPANAGDAGPTTGQGRPCTPRGERCPCSEACPLHPESSARSCNWRTPGTATKTQHSPNK